MTYENPTQQESPTDPCDACPGVLDELSCQAEGVKAQADYNAGKLADLNKAREDYRKARGAYSAARAEVDPAVQAARRIHKQVLEQLECLIKKDAIIACLKKSYEWVARRLADCPGGTSGCCMPEGEDCEFDTGCERKADVLAGQVARFTDRVVAAEKCFAELVKEPAELKLRVAAVKKVIDDIAAALKGDTEKLDLRRLYVRALVAGRDLDEVWHGFADVNAYITCLCKALTCMVKGHNALGELKGAQAVLVCLQRAKETCCASLRENIIEEIVARFLKDCGDDAPADSGAASATGC